MNEETLFFILLALGFAVILWFEWRYQLRSLRVGAAVLALAMLWFFQPFYHAAWRQAISTPPAERVTHWYECVDLDECAVGTPEPTSDSLGPALSEYQSGVFTMHRAVIGTSRGYANERLLMLCILFWLACSPVLRRARDDVRQARVYAVSDVVVPEE